MNIAIVGLGLIGGSIAKALKKYTEHYLIGIDIDERIASSALENGAIDEIGGTDSLVEADVIFLCLYPNANIEFAKKNSMHLKQDSIVTDTSGVKGTVCQKINKIAKRNGFIFVGGHPMAGKENSGFIASEADLFKNASYILIPGDAPSFAIDTIGKLAYDMKFSDIKITDEIGHDKMIAMTSQVPHVIACAYILNPLCKNHHGFSDGSYEDITKVAKINPRLWSELFMDNKEALLGEIETLNKNIAHIKNLIENDDIDSLELLLERCSELKREIDR